MFCIPIEEGREQIQHDNIYCTVSEYLFMNLWIPILL